MSAVAARGLTQVRANPPGERQRDEHDPSYRKYGFEASVMGPFREGASPATLSRQLARLRQLGVIKRVTGTYRYYLTRAGRAAIAAGRRLTEQTIIPALA